MNLAVIVVSSVALGIYVAPLLPLVVALVTKSGASGAVKGTLLALLSVVVALVAPAVQNGADITIDEKFVGAFVVTFLVALGTHLGLAKPLGLTDPAGDGPLPSVAALKIPFVPEIG